MASFGSKKNNIVIDLMQTNQPLFERLPLGIFKREYFPYRVLADQRNGFVFNVVYVVINRKIQIKDKRPIFREILNINQT